MKSVIVLLILALLLEISISACYGSSYPQILEVTRLPIDPPPIVNVNVTCMIQDRYGLVNVSLLFSVNSGIYNVNKMQIIDGDFYNGTFYEQIPGQSIDTTVEYYVLAVDSIGYIAQSPSFFYEVSYDKAGPMISDVSVAKPLGSPVLPTEEVNVKAIVADLGSGVKNATLFYGAVEDPFGTNYNQTSMTRVSGTDYNCTFMGTIPPFPNGSRVYYFVGAYDMANNSAEQNQRAPYYVSEPPSSWLQISNINVLTVDLNNLTATVNMRFDAQLPSPNEPDYFAVQITNVYSSGDLVDSPITIGINSTESQRYSYGGNVVANFHLIGNPSRYPYDSYSLNLTCLVYWLQPASVRVGGTYFGDYHLFNVWGFEPKIEGLNTTDSRGNTVLVATITLNRDPANVLPLLLLITVLFFVLGGAMLLDPAKMLSERLTVFLAVLVFVAGFFFSLGSMVPYRLGFTIAELLVLMLVIGSGVFTLSSLFSNLLADRFGSEKNILKISAVEASFTAIFFYLAWATLSQIPMQDLLPLAFAIWFGLLGRFILNLTRRFSQQTKSVSSDSQHKHYREEKKLVESIEEVEKEKLRIEKRIQEINTRESSTLVLSTVASTVSLAILTMLVSRPFDERINWGLFALLFAFLGFLYRELTIHSSEIGSYRELRRKLSLEATDVSFPAFLRMVIVRLFLLLPFPVFCLLVAPSSVFISAMGILTLSLTFSMCERVRRVDC